MLQVHSIETLGTHEGPGIRLVVFLQGCNINCLYCHNPDTKSLAGGREMTVSEILELAERQRPYFGDNGGVTISGGEPTLKANELIVLFGELKKRGIHTALDTNGTIDTGAVRELYALTDLLLLDIKHINNIWHRKITDTTNDVVMRMAKYREESGLPVWLRYVLLPGYTDQEEYLLEFGRIFTDFGTVERLEILPYHTLGVQKYEALSESYQLVGVTAPSLSAVKRARDVLLKYFKNVVIR